MAEERVDPDQQETTRLPRIETGGDEIVRHEEELRVDTETVEAGEARLRKWVETAPVALDVELRHETVRIVREPLDEPADPEQLAEATLEVVLRAERPVVSKQVVAKERVSLETGVVTTTETVADELRRERVEVDGDLPAA
jgi:uncharacterized protein (TIGR02271 family)